MQYILWNNRQNKRTWDEEKTKQTNLRRTRDNAKWIMSKSKAWGKENVDINIFKRICVVQSYVQLSSNAMIGKPCKLKD